MSKIFAIMVALMIGLTACVTPPREGGTITGVSPETRQAAARIVLQLATTRYFHANPEKAKAAVAITSAAIPLVADGSIENLDQLSSLVDAQIDWDFLLPGEKAALRDLLIIIRAEFEMQVGTQFNITADQRNRAVLLLETIRLAATSEPA